MYSSNAGLLYSLQDECYNYIKVLVPRNDETLFACGTNAFNPACRNYKVSTVVWHGCVVLHVVWCTCCSRVSLGQEI